MDINGRRLQSGHGRVGLTRWNGRSEWGTQFCNQALSRADWKYTTWKCGTKMQR